MSDKEEEIQSFKVVDKRRFSDSGESLSKKDSIPAADEAKAPQANSPQAHNPNESNTTIQNQDARTEEGSERLDFPSFLVGIYSQTLIFLGEIPNPETNVVTKNLDAARQNIDILNILEEKTKGNLSFEEENLMQEILNNLRLLFVKKI